MYKHGGGANEEEEEVQKNYVHSPAQARPGGEGEREREGCCSSSTGGLVGNITCCWPAAVVVVVGGTDKYIVFVIRCGVRRNYPFTVCKTEDDDDDCIRTYRYL